MSPDKMSRTKCRGQNVMWTKCHWTKCHGQNVADKMSRTKCSGQNVVDKMSQTKGRGQYVVDKMSQTKGRGQYVVDKMAWSKGRGQYVVAWSKCHGQKSKCSGQFCGQTSVNKFWVANEYAICLILYPCFQADTNNTKLNRSNECNVMYRILTFG